MPTGVYDTNQQPYTTVTTAPDPQRVPGGSFTAYESVAGRPGPVPQEVWEKATGGLGGGSASDTADYEDASLIIRETLELYGISGLDSWVMEQLVNGASPEAILISLRQQPSYKARFPGMEARVNNGFNAMSEAEYLAYEDYAKALLRANNLPVGVFDSTEYLGNLIAKNVSPEELSNRVRGAYAKVANGPKEIRETFDRFFGTGNGDAALASFLLDPERTEAQILEAAEQAEVGGIGMRFGLELDLPRADRIQDLQLSSAQLESRFAQLSSIKGAFKETIGESQNFTAEGIGVDATFGFDPDALDSIQSRIETRVAGFTGGTQAAQNQRGAFGLGSV